MQLPLKQLGQSGATSGQVVTWNSTSGHYEPGASNLAGGISVSNRDMVALVTTADNQLATNTTLAATIGAWVEVQVNGVGVEIGDGVKTKGCYLSGDNGTTARAYGALASGDKLYWVGSAAGYELSGSDRIDVIYDNEGAGGGGGGGSITMGVFGSTPNTDGGSIGAGILTLQPADGTNPGGVSTTTQTLAGVKTFTDGINNGGNVVANVSDGVIATDGASYAQVVTADNRTLIQTLTLSMDTTLDISSFVSTRHLIAFGNAVTTPFTPTITDITGPITEDLWLLTFIQTHSIATVTFAHNAPGNIRLVGGVDAVLSPGGSIVLAYGGALGYWFEVSRSQV